MTSERDERPPYVSFYASAWLAGCATLPPMAEWVYLQISAYNMDKGETVPPQRLQMILVRHGGDWQADVDLLIDLGKVVKTASGGVFVNRALIEYERAENALTKKRRAGKRGAEKRWKNKDKDSTANGTANGDANEKACDTNGSRVEKSRGEIDHPSDDTITAQGDFLDRVDPDTWHAFVEHRIKLKKPMTDRAAGMIRNKLAQLAEDGHDPNRVLEQSIRRGWLDVFPLKDDDRKKSGWRFPDE